MEKTLDESLSFHCLMLLFNALLSLNSELLLSQSFFLSLLHYILLTDPTKFEIDIYAVKHRDDEQRKVKHHIHCKASNNEPACFVLSHVLISIILIEPGRKS